MKEFFSLYLIVILSFLYPLIFLPFHLSLFQFSQYEILWQNQLFINIRYNNTALIITPLFAFIRHLESCYPQFPSEKEFINVVQGEEDDKREGGEGYVSVGTLKRFVLEKERLQVSTSY